MTRPTIVKRWSRYHRQWLTTTPTGLWRLRRPEGVLRRLLMDIQCRDWRFGKKRWVSEDDLFLREAEVVYPTQRCNRCPR